MVAKAVPKKGKKRAKASVQKAKPFEDALVEYRKVIDARYRIASSTYEAQDNLTKEAIDRIRDRLRIAATGVVNINGRPYQLESEYVDFNLLFIAVEIVSDLALNGIRVANFKFGDVFCSICKKQLLNVREPKQKRRR